MVSCNNYTNQVYRTPDFPYVTDVNNIKFLTDDICVNTVSDIFKYGEHLYIIAYDAQNQTYLQAYDIKTGERLYSTIRYGNGPGEIIYPNISYFDYDSGHLHFYDKVSERIFEYDLSNQVSLVAENISTNFPWITHYFPIKSLGNLTMMAIKEGASEQLNNARISLINDQNQVVSEYNNFPIESDKNIQYAVYQTDRADISMDKQHLIVGTSYGSILEIFDITEGIMPKAVKYFVEPTLILREGKYNNDDTIIEYVNAINEYRNMSHDNDRTLAICVVSVIWQKSFKSGIATLKELGYEDITESEINTAFSSVHSLKNIANYKECSQILIIVLRIHLDYWTAISKSLHTFRQVLAWLPNQALLWLLQGLHNK